MFSFLGIDGENIENSIYFRSEYTCSVSKQKPGDYHSDGGISTYSNDRAVYPNKETRDYPPWVLLLFIYSLVYFLLFVGGSVFVYVCCALLCVHSGFAFVLRRKRNLVALL